jgi:hypothetical protein
MILRAQEHAKARNHSNRPGKRAVARVCHALPDSAMPFWLDVLILYCLELVLPCSGHDLGAVRFNFRVFCMVFGEFRSWLDVHMYAAYAD